MEIYKEYDECPVCNKNHGQAFNGILQLRNPSEEVVLLIEYEIDRNHERNWFCLKKTKVVNGYDYQFNAAPFVKYLGKRLQQEFGGELKETARLVTRSRQTSKDLYRVTIMFRIPDFKKGDVVNYKGNDVRVLNFGNKVFVQDTKTSKKQRVDYKDLKKKND